MGTSGLDGGGGTAVRGEIHFLVCHFVCQDGKSDGQGSSETIKNREGKDRGIGRG